MCLFLFKVCSTGECLVLWDLFLVFFFHSHAVIIRGLNRGARWNIEKMG